jgi:SPP1 gp7 family putative phage head morphogenesis protein
LRQYQRGSKSVFNWVSRKRTGATFSEETLPAVLGNTDAAAFIKFQSFTIATVENDHLLRRVHAALAGNIKRGETAKSFAEIVNTEFDKAGVSRLKPYHLETVFRTNTALAFSAGQNAALLSVKDDFPFWRYSALNDRRTRPSHRKLDGKIFPTGDFKWYPPIGFNCRCSAVPITKEEADTENITASPLSDLDALGVADKEFVGNKSEKFLTWIEKQIPSLSKPAQENIRGAVEAMKDVVLERDKEDWEILRKNKDFAELEISLPDNVKRTATKLGLSESEAAVIHGYTTELFHKELNDYLKLSIVPKRNTASFLRAYRRQLDAALSKLPTLDQPEVVRFRNAFNENEKKLYRSGSVVVFNSFESASIVPDDESFYAMRPVKLIFKHKSMRSIEEFSAAPFEKETLSMTGKRYKATYAYQEDYHFVVILEEQ